MESKRV